MEKIDRRSVLKAGALGAAGVAAGALGLEAVIPAAAADLTTTTGSGRPIPQTPGQFTRLPSILTPPTPGTTYTEIGGITAFKPRNSASGFAQVGGNAPGIRPSTAADYFIGSLPLPPNATLTEFVYTFLLNDANTVALELDFITSGVDTVLYFNGGYSTQSVSYQSVALAFTPKLIPVDSFLIPYFGFGSFADTQVLISARAGYINEPGLTTFANPRRCLGNGTTTLAEAFILNIDATQKISAGGPTGVPAGAKAAFCAVQSYQPGVMTLYPAGTADTGTANWSVNGTPGQLQMLYMLVPLDSTGKFNIHNRFTDKTIYVDVWGFLMAP
jgi:hypothetical protein